ncbi:hypothetical protein B0H12DRAFT_706235 [Mycena haematopus]|nr:hypothetical protein B0H12DRAFT_706235 [Mycena haematopus]
MTAIAAIIHITERFRVRRWWRRLRTRPHFPTSTTRRRLHLRPTPRSPFVRYTHARAHRAPAHKKNTELPCARDCSRARDSRELRPRLALREKVGRPSVHVKIIRSRASTQWPSATYRLTMELLSPVHCVFTARSVSAPIIKIAFRLRYHKTRRPAASLSPSFAPASSVDQIFRFSFIRATARGAMPTV